jgi:hypothetical protein
MISNMASSKTNFVTLLNIDRPTINPVVLIIDHKKKFAPSSNEIRIAAEKKSEYINMAALFVSHRFTNRAITATKYTSTPPVTISCCPSFYVYF